MKRRRLVTVRAVYLVLRYLTREYVTKVAAVLRAARKG